jgi:hypothetical protein
VCADVVWSVFTERLSPVQHMTKILGEWSLEITTVKIYSNKKFSQVVKFSIEGFPLVPKRFRKESYFVRKFQVL